MIPFDILNAFSMPNKCCIRKLKGGFLHDSYLVESDYKRLVIQRISPILRASANKIVANSITISKHVNSSVEIPVIVPEPLVAKSGDLIVCYKDELWRGFAAADPSYIPGDQISGKLYEIARAFGNYVLALHNFNAKLEVTIESFHDLRLRYQSLLQVARQSTNLKESFNFGYANLSAEKLLEQIKSISFIVETYEEIISKLPSRFVHNDTKVSNVLICSGNSPDMVIDLDTTMKGFILADFGDLVRSGASLMNEEADTIPGSLVSIEGYKDIVRGFLEPLKPILHEFEIANLSFGVIWMTFEVAVRFLTDHIQHDQYFRVRKRGDNLRRAYGQLQLTAKLLDIKTLLDKIVFEYAKL
jgi:Ser/Thr protein kinase RdoA (MazF antagonist)